MSGQDILIEQLRGEVERLRERAEKAEANYAFMVERAADQKLDGYRELGARAAAAEERAEKAERFIATADSEWKARAEKAEFDLAAVAMCDPGDCGRCVSCLYRRAEKAERELDRLRSDAKTLAAEHFAADYRAAIARADKAEDERDEARAERDARPAISAEDAALRWQETHEGIAANAIVEAALDAHGAKAVKP